MALAVCEKIFSLIKPAVESAGVKLWDVCFVKEGASYFLRVYIDKEGGIGIDDCTNVSHLIDPIIDEADPIDKSYYLEVCSPGLERKLTRPEHFEAFLGQKVKVKLYKAYNGSKEIFGSLAGYSEEIEIDLGDQTVKFSKKDISAVRLDDIDF